MSEKYICHKVNRGFTLIELMICVSIIGVLAATAIPMFLRQQLRARSAEASTNLSAIRVSEESYFAGKGFFLPALAEPVVPPGSQKAVFDAVGSDFSQIGWAPEGQVYFQYAVNVTADGSGFTTDAAGDLDGNGVPQLWGYMKTSVLAATTDGGVGCLAADLIERTVQRCGTNTTTF